jgi:hypothetical protein
MSGNSTDEYEGYIYASIICAFFSLGFSAVSVLILMAIPETLIKVSLLFVVLLSGVWAVLSFISGSIILGVMGLVFFAISCCYARAVWGRIPFASCNLVTACTAIKSNWGVVLYGYFFAILAAGWSIMWAFAFVGTFDKTYDCNDNGNDCGDPNYGYLFLLFVAYFFSHQVLQVSQSCMLAWLANQISMTERYLQIHQNSPLLLLRYYLLLLYTYVFIEHGPCHCRRNAWKLVVRTFGSKFLLFAGRQ